MRITHNCPERTAAASSLLIVDDGPSILRSCARAASIAALLTGEHSVLYVVLRMENCALLAGTAALFVVLGALMFFTRNVDWFAPEAGKEAWGEGDRKVETQRPRRAQRRKSPSGIGRDAEP